MKRRVPERPASSSALRCGSETTSSALRRVERRSAWAVAGAGKIARLQPGGAQDVVGLKPMVSVSSAAVSDGRACRVYALVQLHVVDGGEARRPRTARPETHHAVRKTRPITVLRRSSAADGREQSTQWMLLLRPSEGGRRTCCVRFGEAQRQAPLHRKDLLPCTPCNCPRASLGGRGKLQRSHTRDRKRPPNTYNTLHFRNH